MQVRNLWKEFPRSQANLREKIKDHASWAITTVWGIGYKFEVKR